jgi:hypothetical protein
MKLRSITCFANVSPETLAKDVTAVGAFLDAARTRYRAAGYEVQTHRHTGPVFGYTTSGAWKYKEYDYVNRAGSFLYEPAGSVHTLQCIEDETRVWFQMYGSNLNLDEQGEIASVVDGQVTLQFYLAACKELGLAEPNVLIE